MLNQPDSVVTSLVPSKAAADMAIPKKRREFLACVDECESLEALSCCKSLQSVDVHGTEATAAGMAALLALRQSQPWP